MSNTVLALGIASFFLLILPACQITAFVATNPIGLRTLSSAQTTHWTSDQISAETSVEEQHQEVSISLESFTPITDNSTYDFAPSFPENEECLIGTEQNTTSLDTESCLPLSLVTLPRHSNPAANEVLERTESILRDMYVNEHNLEGEPSGQKEADESAIDNDRIYANNYVDLGKIDTDALLELIYERALERLIKDRYYPETMLTSGLSYDPFFSIRGLAVDKETGWITHLSYTHKVAVAWEGRRKLPSSRIFEEYRGKRALTPAARKKRLKPLNDLFSMAECCLIADTIQFFNDHDIPYCPQNVVTDVLKAVTDTHLSGEFHREVAQNPEVYFEPTPHLKNVLRKLKQSGKRLIFVSNSPFWYVDAGMRYIFGDCWREEWDAIITSAGKPAFYTESARPFREVCLDTLSINFKKVDKFEPGNVYTEGCLRELTRLMDWSLKEVVSDANFIMGSGTHDIGTPHALYIGDSLFADLVDAKREFGWTTAAVTPEVGYETKIQGQRDFELAVKSIDILLNALRRIQEVLGTGVRTAEDIETLNLIENLVSQWRDRETQLLGNPFGSVFRARYQPSLFAHSLRRYSDLYMNSVSSLRHYSPQHRFYPEQHGRLLAHEMNLLKRDGEGFGI